jgi:hypothetical protein
MAADCARIPVRRNRRESEIEKGRLIPPLALPPRAPHVAQPRAAGPLVAGLVYHGEVEVRRVDLPHGVGDRAGVRDGDDLARRAMLCISASRVPTSASSCGTFSMHWLRHSHGSILISAGVSLKVVSTALGHSSIKITLDTYAHLMPGDRETAAAALDRAFTAQKRDGHFSGTSSQETAENSASAGPSA